MWETVVTFMPTKRVGDVVIVIVIMLILGWKSEYFTTFIEVIAFGARAGAVLVPWRMAALWKQQDRDLQEQAWRSDESARLSLMWPGFVPGLLSYVDWVCCWFWCCSEGFSPGSLVFFLPQKPTSPNSSSTRIEEQHGNQLRLVWLPWFMTFQTALVIAVSYLGL